MKPPTAYELRAWARGNVPTRGVLPHSLITAWNKAHPSRPYPDRRAGPGAWPDKWADVRKHHP